MGRPGGWRGSGLGSAFGFLVQVVLCGAWATGALAQTLESVLSPGPIASAHAKIEHECGQCHVRGDRSAQDGLCIECHKDVGRDVRRRSGFHGRREPQSCRACHREHRGRDKELSPLDPKSFDHRGTDFTLRDKHVGLDCARCHVAGRKWREAATDCVGCHQKDDVHKSGLGRRCDECHNARGWRDVADFDHGKRTRFALLDKHASAKCEACHAQGRYKDTPRSCIGCHRKDDEHKGQFGEKCESCHGAKAWRTTTFNHDTETRFALKDRHRTVACSSCHSGPVYRVKPGSACIDCHAKDDTHKQTLGRDCAACHSERGWKEPQGFDHEKSHFPLRGRHVRVACRECHADALYRRTPDRCVDCHRKDDRHAGTLGAECQTCHGADDWKRVDGRFDHQRTRFPLRNAHAAPKVACTACHADARSYRGVATACVECHRKDDRHEATLGERCESCHDDSGWRIARFDHARARFALTGGHLVVACTSCHRTLRYRDAPRDCSGCHDKDDVHKAGLGTRCDGCHNTRAWRLWTFDHDRRTHYPLLGAHKTLRCARCHEAPAPAGAATAPVGSECIACHRGSDVHDGRFGRRCEQCHVPERWTQVKGPRQGVTVSPPPFRLAMRPLARLNSGVD